MPSPRGLASVLHHPALWRGNDCARVAVPSLPTGHAPLDALLPGGGWPRGALTEICAARMGVGELRLLMPAAAGVTRDGRWLVLVAPPYVPYAPALAAYGVNLAQLVVVQPPTAREALWACDQALRSGACGMVLHWPLRLDDRDARRLQSAAEKGGTAGFLFRAAVPHSSPAALRLALAARDGRTEVRVLKRRGGGTPAPVLLDPAPHAAPAAPAPAHRPAFAVA